jgi:hypothetical protein
MSKSNSWKKWVDNFGSGSIPLSIVLFFTTLFIYLIAWWKQTLQQIPRYPVTIRLSSLQFHLLHHHHPHHCHTVSSLSIPIEMKKIFLQSSTTLNMFCKKNHRRDYLLKGKQMKSWHVGSTNWHRHFILSTPHKLNYFFITNFSHFPLSSAGYLRLYPFHHIFLFHLRPHQRHHSLRLLHRLPLPLPL